MMAHIARKTHISRGYTSTFVLSRSFGQFMATNVLTRSQGSLLNNSPTVLITQREASKKSKGKGKGKKGGGSTKLDLSLGGDILDLHEIHDKMSNSTRRLTDMYREKFATALTAHVLDKIGVDVGGSRCRLNEIAEVNASGKEFVITCVDNTDAKAIGKAIQKNLNIVVTFENSLIRVPMMLSSEYRKDLVKPVKEAADKALRDIRDVQQNAAKKLKKDKSSEDLIEPIEKQVQLMFEMYNAQTKDLLSNKLDELQK